MRPRTRRFALIGAGLVLMVAAALLVLNAFRSNLVFFFTPTQIAKGEVPKGRSFRVGGLVEAGSVRRDRNGLTVHFVMTDTVERVPVSYTGILPDLFKEGKGAVAQGEMLGDGTFMASEVLAKHDENYMPPEAAEAIARAKETAARTGKSVTPPTE